MLYPLSYEGGDGLEALLTALLEMVQRCRVEGNPNQGSCNVAG